MLKFCGLTKRYGDFTALDDLKLEVAPGEIYGFIGHNGAGKTTAIRSAVGALEFDAGDVLIGGHSIIKEPLECKRLLAYIPDNPDIYDHLTGRQYVNFVADIFGVGEARTELIEKYAALFSMTHKLDELISEYSHGMKQKVSVIAALVHSPKLLILDEPFVGLDPSAAHTLKLLMRELCDNGSAIFFSTHVLEVAEKLCDKVAIIKNGRLIVSGTMEQVRGDSSLEDVFLELVEDDKA